MGSDPLAVPALIGCGLRKFSMGSASVAAVKKAIASVTVAQTEEIAQKVLELSTAAEIENFLNTLKK